MKTLQVSIEIQGTITMSLSEKIDTCMDAVADEIFCMGLHDVFSVRDSIKK